MIVRVTLETSINNMIKNVGIPFFAARTSKDLYAKNVNPNLSRSEVEIGGKLRDNIISCVYKEEVDRLISGIKEQVKSGQFSAVDLKRNVISNCKLLRYQNVTYKDNSIVILKNNNYVTQIYGSWEIFANFVKCVECDYCSHEINKSDLGNMIEEGQVKGVGIDYLCRYIYHATGSYNGLRMKAIRKIFDKLNINDIPYDNATNMWKTIISKKEQLKEKWEKYAQDGIIWFDEEYKSWIKEKGTFDNVVVTEQWKDCVDKKFADILECELQNNANIGRYLVLH